MRDAFLRLILGFHNAVVQCNSKVKFIDFEYAGWDDPAKTAADFIFQPQVPPPYDCFETIVDLLQRNSHNQQKLRAELLKPLFGTQMVLHNVELFYKRLG